jgi:hypothetical protein
VKDFLDWQAPWLLLLPDLPDQQRRRYEQLARVRALVVEEQFRLYPEVIDPQQLDIARVEARLRRNMPAEEREPATASPISG